MYSYWNIKRAHQTRAKNQQLLQHPKSTTAFSQRVFATFQEHSRATNQQLWQHLKSTAELKINSYGNILRARR
jgi:hypothetical protein